MQFVKELNKKNKQDLKYTISNKIRNDPGFQKSLILCLKSGQDLQENFQFHEIIAVKWLQNICQSAVHGLVTNQVVNFNRLLEKQALNGKESEFRKQSSFLIRYCLELMQGIIDQSKNLPNSLKSFIYCMFIQGRDFPNEYFTSYEKNRIQLQNNKLMQFPSYRFPNKYQQDFLICFYFISKILIAKLLLRPWKFQIEMDNNQKENLKFMASIIQSQMVQNYLYFGRDKTEKRIIESDVFVSDSYTKTTSKNYDGISDKLYSFNQIQYLFKKLQEFGQKLQDQLNQIGNLFRSQSNSLGKFMCFPAVDSDENEFFDNVK